VSPKTHKNDPVLSSLKMECIRVSSSAFAKKLGGMHALFFLCKLAVKNVQYLQTATEFDINTWQWGGVT
jgi:hypothetical protein